MKKKNGKAGNPFAGRLAKFAEAIASKKLDVAALEGRFDIRAMTGVDCDCACLLVEPSGNATLYTDFRYFAEIARTSPWLKTGDLKRLSGKKPFSRGRAYKRVGCEFSAPHSRFLTLRKAFPGAKLSDVAPDAAALRAVKTPAEQDALRAAEALNDAIWNDARRAFRPGMTEIEMAKTVKRLMLERGEGEAFQTIVCVGRNAAECHHVPDGTVWTGREPVLVDLGVKLGGYCSDMTRNIVPERPSRLYRKVYSLVLEANMRAIQAARPGMRACDLDAVARRFLAKNGFGRAFGHSLGHGVGLQVHEKPAVAKTRKDVLEAGMAITIEPGVYLEGNLGVRIEDLVLLKEGGCEVLSHSEK